MDKSESYYFKTLFIVILMLSVGCSRNLSGVYVLPGFSPNYLGYSFNKDSTFCLNTWSDLVGKDEICGKWKISKDTILLFQNPDKIKIESKPVATFNESNSDPSKIRILVQDTNNEPIPGVKLVFNNKPETYITNKDGVFETSYYKVDKLEVQYIGIGKRSFSTRAGFNLFVIKLDFDAAGLRLKRISLPEKLLWVGHNIYDLKRDTVILDHVFRKTNRKPKKVH